ncbi:NADH:ubiquinone oxidoreductase subunit J [Comamonas serinivorans]|uniref:NADH-quinone oxidoreductase subunit J n=1 Tax=Comamonas serinivorans TaxID=1082851 RepID=A0A1Y0ELD8_9BURK|nr:NADH-quinone oxidoreductase subunit J [Comamonas serinivorans]ARU04122.1 NADH:ubiquinone oxidoreductase subunit J [Comamonas serinivorans]
MNFSTVFFYLFSVVLLFSAFRVVTARNPVHAVLFLMLAFSQAAGLWLLLRAEFLAITLVLVYLGAVMVLFLFVVMMLDIRIDGVREGFWRQVPVAVVIGAVVVVQLVTVLMGSFGLVDAPLQPMGDEIGNTKALGILLYTQYLYPIQIAAAILLVAMVAAIALTLRRRKDTKKLDASVQVRVKAGDRLQMVKMAPTPEAQPVADAAAEEKKA